MGRYADKGGIVGLFFWVTLIVGYTLALVLLQTWTAFKWIIPTLFGYLVLVGFAEIVAKRVRWFHPAGLFALSLSWGAYSYAHHEPYTEHGRIGAICVDGWKSHSTGRGTCSHHGGVHHWLYATGTHTSLEQTYWDVWLLVPVNGAVLCAFALGHVNRRGHRRKDQPDDANAIIGYKPGKQFNLDLD